MSSRQTRTPRRARAGKRLKAGRSQSRVALLDKSGPGTRWLGSWLEIEGAAVIALLGTTFFAFFKYNAKEG